MQFSAVMMKRNRARVHRKHHICTQLLGDDPAEHARVDRNGEMPLRPKRAASVGSGEAPGLQGRIHRTKYSAPGALGPTAGKRRSRAQMAGASRLLRSTRALQSVRPPSSSSSSSCHLPPLKFPCNGGEKQSLRSCSQLGRNRVAVSSEAALVLPDTKQKPSSLEEGLGIAHLAGLMIAKVAGELRRFLNPPNLEMKHWRTYAEMLIERGVTGCRFFTLIAVAGSLVGSILCFVEGCFFVLEAFYQYFQTVSSSMEQGRIIQSLVEGIDMFLVGTALLTFGIGLYVMFARSEEMKRRRGWKIAESRFGAFDLKKLANSMEMQSISHAKSRVGHAVLLILQAGVVDKFKSVQLTSGLDLACFAGAVFVSSACVFLLSKLSISHSKNAFSRAADLMSK